MPQENSAYAEVVSCSAATQLPGSLPPIIPQQMGVFSHDIIIEDGGHLENRAANSIISVALHLAVIALLALLSFLTPMAMHMRPLTRAMLIIPLPPSKAAVVNRRHAPGAAKSVLASVELVAPVFSSRGNEFVSLGSPPQLGTSRSDSSASAFAIGDVLGGIVSSTPAPLISPVLPDSLRQVHLGGAVTNSRPLSRLILAYPALAKAAHVFGRVVIRAMIDETGKVVNARAISGPPLLYVTALQAVSKERFQPMLLNGEPTKCGLTVQVSFMLSDDRF